MASWGDVRKYALALPGASEGRTARGWRAWIVDKRLFTWERPLLKPDFAALGDNAPTGPVLGVRTADLEMKQALLASNSRVYFTTPHFDGYPAVLIRLETIATKELKAVIREAWCARAPKRVVDDFLRGEKSQPSRKQRP
jgi:hypothetical protein